MAADYATDFEESAEAFIPPAYLLDKRLTQKDEPTGIFLIGSPK